jgi:murein DD-endopeptidase MepM/ murein hydrolase activator NlpD
MEKFYSAWKKFRTTEQLKESYKNKLVQLEKDRKVLNEVSLEAANKIYDWMRDASGMDYSFQELFDGKMRMAMPFDTEDALNLKKAVRAMKKDGWKAGELVPWEGGTHTAGKFKTKMVKQKRQRLADQGGGFYEEEIEVADLGLGKSYEKEIPAGPRKGEIIQRTDKLGMGKVIAKLVKEKKLDKELLDWWHQRQTYYTKDRNWKEIEGLFSGDEVDYTVIISRHPIDVLRMSDVGSIQSCHSEGASHWHCAKAEAKGHGPIAYLVPTSDYEKLMVGLYSEQEARPSDFEARTNRTRRVMARAAQEYINRHFLQYERNWRTIYRQRDNAELVEFGIEAVQTDWAAKKAFEDLPATVRGMLGDQEILDAIVAHAEGKEQPLMKIAAEQEEEPDKPEEPAEISEFDDKEIFRDRDRGIKGIVAKGRVRFRKFEDEESGFQFVAPEHRTYGAVPPGFVNSMVKWAAESQEGALKDRGFLGDEGFAPDWYSLTRYGGSYEDTTDGEVLTALFQHYDPKFDGFEYGNVNSESDEEEEDLFNEYEEAISELNDQASNTLEHISCYASVDEGGGMDGMQPLVMASANVEFEIHLDGWAGLEPEDEEKFYSPLNHEFEGQPGTNITLIPHSWGSSWEHKRTFESLLDVLDYGGEIEWGVSLSDTPRSHGKGSVVLTVEFRVDCEDCSAPDDYDSFIDYMKSDIDDKYDQFREKIRLALVEEEHIARNYFDKMLYPAGWDEESEEPTETPVEIFARDLKHFDYTPPDKDGELIFKTQELSKSGLSSYISSGVIFPEELKGNQGHTAVGTRMSVTAADLQSVFGGERFPISGAGSVPALKHTGHGLQKIAQALSDIEAEAKEKAEQQLALDFGDEYKEKYNKVLPDFAKDTEMYTILKSHERSNLGFGLRITARSMDSEREIKGALAFVKHIDDNIDRVHQAFERLWQPAIDEAIEKKEKAEAAAVSRGTADQLLKALDTYSMRFDDVPADDPGFNPRAAAAKALITWTEESWDEMTMMERRVLINQFLRPVQQGSLSTVHAAGPSGEGSTPRHWTEQIQAALREAGAGWSVIQSYRWAGPSYGKIYARFAPTPQGEEPLSIGGVRQGAPVRATMGDPRPAGGPVQDMEINEPPEDIREAIRNAIRGTIYKQGPQKVSKNSNLKEAIRKAFEESLYSQGGPEDLPSMGPGLPKRDDDEEEIWTTGGSSGKDSPSSLKVSIKEAIFKALKEQRENIVPGMEEIAAGNLTFQPSEATLEPVAQMGMQYDDPTPQEKAYLDFRKHYAKTPMYDQESGTAYQQRDWLDMGQLPGEPGWVDNTMPEDDVRRHERGYPGHLTRGTPDEWLSNVTAEDAAMDPRYDRWMQQAGLRPGDPGFDVDNLYGPEEEIPENIYSAPVTDPRITSAGWAQRESPGINTNTGKKIPGAFHSGTDVGGRTGDPVYSTLPGRVLSSYLHPGYGWNVVIQHIDPRTGTPMTTRDAHFMEDPGLNPGDWVEGGAQIGSMGQTGRATGPHLHHEEHGLGGRLTDPRVGAKDQTAAENEIKKELDRRAYWQKQGIPFYPTQGQVGHGYGAERSWPSEWGRPASPDRPDYTQLVGPDEPIEPGIPPQLIKPPPINLREVDSSALKNAIREAIKIKVRGAPPPEEDCELPTLEEAYIQNVYEATCSLNIHKQRGGNRDQTLTDIRGIPGVTIVSVVPGTTRDLPHTFITGLSIKFELNRNLPPRNYVKSTLLPGMQKIPGVSNFQVRTIDQVTAAEDEM